VRRSPADPRAGGLSFLMRITPGARACTPGKAGQAASWREAAKGEGDEAAGRVRVKRNGLRKKRKKRKKGVRAPVAGGFFRFFRFLRRPVCCKPMTPTTCPARPSVPLAAVWVKRLG
jgi:hypothetical protein